MRRLPKILLLPAMVVCLLATSVMVGPSVAGFGPDGKPGSAEADSADCDPASNPGFSWLERNLNRHFGAAPLKPEKATSEFINAGVRFERYTGMIISEIRFTRHRLFSGHRNGENENGAEGSSRIRGLAEATHMSTRVRVLRNNLLFKSGDRVDPYILAENERLLRRLSFIEDAHIVVTQDIESPIFVSVEIITRDRWSLGATAKIHASDNIEVDLFERNFLGQGHNLENTFLVVPNDGSGLGYEGRYGVRNMGGSFVDSRFEYRDTHRERKNNVELRRDLVSSELRVVAGLVWDDHTNRDDAASLAAGGSPWTRSEFRSIWLGRAFPLGGRDGSQHIRRLLIISTGIDDRSWKQRPPVSNGNGSPWWNRRRYLTRATLAGNSHFESSWVRGFGRTEDIARGYMLSVIGGLEDGEFERHPYFGVETGIGSTCDSFGYFNGVLGIGGYRHDGHWRRSTIDFRFDYYSNLAESGEWKFRQFARLDYTHGWNRDDDEKIFLGDDFGLQDLPGPRHAGQRRLILNIESIAHSPLTLFGFHIAGFAFADAGVIAPANTSLFASPMHASLGVGLRIRNESLVFRTIEMRFAFFPGPVADEDRLAWNISSGDKSLPQGFYRTQPGVVEFR